MTQHAYVIGWPIAHSLSPAIHNAAFAALGIQATYAAAEVPPAELSEWVRLHRTPDTLGFNVTLPHKIAVRDHLDAVEGDAILAGAVNTVVAEPDGNSARLRGANTDTIGFRRLLHDEGHVTCFGQSILLLGAGGGARAVALVALQDRAAHLWIANRHPERARELANNLAVPDLSTEVEVLGLDDPQVASVLQQATVVVNATSVGLASDELPLDVSAIHAGAVALDLIYNPAETAFLRQARQHGAHAVGGLGMLVYQAAAAFERWTTREAPVKVMRSAAEAALAARARS